MWIRLWIDNRRFMNIPFPIPLYIFRELLDCFQDLLAAACFFVPKVPDPGLSSQITIDSVKDLVIMAMKLLDSLAVDAPYDLVDVTTDKVKVIIKIR
uniref:hypothetical protein n=1 Tax=Clostridium sp. NkU-1 TaxID=1095009 RepID=UPI0006D05EB1